MDHVFAPVGNIIFETIKVTKKNLCIIVGMRFSLTQIKAALVEIVRNFDIKVNPKTRKDNEIDDTYFMPALKGGVWLDFVERN